MTLLINKLSKIYNQNLILDRINFFVPKGSLAVLIGPSGSGKSSLLRIIAGLDKPTYGSVWLNGKEATDFKIQYRNMGFVFQNSALFKHMNVRENICFGLQLRKLSYQQIISRVNFCLENLRITDIASHYPSQLSGGQKQRVALARSLAIQPNFLLLDEPFGALDGELRRYLTKWLKNYIKINEITTIMVTHDQKEAVSMADEILILKDGHLVQQGEPKTVYDHPINQFVANFLGSLIQTPQNQAFNKIINNSFFFSDPIWLPTLANRSIDNYLFFLRPHEFELETEKTSETSLALLRGIIYKRYFVQLELIIPSFEWKISLQLGYFLFEKLKINSLTQTLYLKPRSKVFQRAYIVKSFENK